MLFPNIEQQRIQIIEKWKDCLNACLPLNDPFEAEIREPIDVEIGTMHYLAHSTFKDGDKRFEIDNATSQMIRLLHKIRNKLAHLDICNPMEIMLFLA